MADNTNAAKEPDKETLEQVVETTPPVGLESKTDFQPETQLQKDAELTTKVDQDNCMTSKGQGTAYLKL